MASRMKKLFHRKKDGDAEETPQHMQAPLTSGRSDPALRSSRYESTQPGALPQTGDYPVKGNDSSIILQQGRRSSVSRSRRNSGSFSNVPHRFNTSNQHEAAKHAPQMIPPSALAESNDPYQQNSKLPVAGQEERRRHHVQQEFSGLNLGNVEFSPTTVTQTVTTTRTVPQGHSTNSSASQAKGHTSQRSPQEHGGYYSSRVAPEDQEYIFQNENPSTTEFHTDSQRQGYASGNNNTSQFQVSAPRHGATSQNREYFSRQKAGPRSSNEGHPQSVLLPQGYSGNLSLDQGFNTSESSKVRHEDDEGLTRQNSIPRKKIGTSAFTTHPIVQASSPRAQTGQSQQQSDPKPLPSIPAAESHRPIERPTDSTPQSSSILNRSRPLPTSQAGLRDAQDIVDRAKTSSLDTTVVETVAPAIVHEKVQKAIHHVREEVITREIHTHDVYHRIQPIIDVEVLPPRHFLPVEGGGLVEISAQEVPGRSSNWVIAETASKIPSDQPAPRGMTQFTARKFSGREGDAVNYMSAEGYEVKEETWVHPPELEEGARLTGQSWPMVIGEKPQEKGQHGYSTPKATKRKSPKTQPTLQASSAQVADRESGRV